MNRMTMSASALISALAVAAPACAQSGSDLTAADRQFLTQDAQGGMYELSIAKLAEQKTTRQDIKSYASMVVNDHEHYNTALQKLAADKGVTLPKEMSAADRTKLDALEKDSGNSFDRTFIQDAKRVNAQDKKDAQQEANQTKDADIKAFIQKFADMDSKHEKGAQDLQE